ncbi:hypothetical protein Y032_0279g1191 [Ancylostoma ceylanicum]|nr:hypothetical protein Y032_0279g1191 [Ancylostoma ceylanicum]
MTAMIRGKLTRIPCYRLMFFNGIIDLLDLVDGSFLTAYFHLTGSVFCTNVALTYFAGHLGWTGPKEHLPRLGVWIGATLNCVALALNRIAEMVPSASGLKFLFQGNRLYIWMGICVAIMIIRMFVTRPFIYNSAVAAYLAAPLITDDIAWETEYYTSLLLPIHNISVAVVLGFLYLFLCLSVLRMTRMTSCSFDKMQLQLFIQALVICTTTAIAALFYVVVEFVALPRSFVIATNVVWQLSHGVHGFVYICLNKQVRTQVRKMIGCAKQTKPIITVSNTITAVN